MIESPTLLRYSSEILHCDIGKIEVYRTPDETAIATAEAIMDVVRHNPTAAITYATGATMEPIYEHIAQHVATGTVDFSQTKAFHLDERYPCAHNDCSGFAHFICERVVRPFGIPLDHASFWNGEAADPHAEAERYGELLSRQPIDLTILGIGPPGKDDPAIGGHIAFNEYGTSFTSGCHYVPLLAEETLHRDRVERGENVPDGAFTQGLRGITSANKIILTAYGTQKGIALYHTLYDEISEDRPASVLRLSHVRNKTHLFIDQMAAAEILAPR